MENPASSTGRTTIEIVLASVSAESAGRGWGLLDEGERRRAEAFRSAPARESYVTARARLRMELGRRLDCAPETPRFWVSPRGKPSLAPPWDSTGWEFNLSHSGKRVAIALSRSMAVGIDLERLDAIPPGEMDALAGSHFSAAEIERWKAVDWTRRMEEFLRIWTRKEAVLKASGEGLVDDLPRVDTATGAGVLGKWWVRDLPLPAGYVGSVAAGGPGWDVSMVDA